MAYVTPKRPALNAPTPETAIPNQPGLFSGALGIGFDAGLKQTTGSWFTDLQANDDARRTYDAWGESEIPEAVYNDDRFALKVDGIQWEPHLSMEMLDRAREAQAVSRRFANTDSWWKYAGFFAGAALDPVNAIPIPFVGAGASITRTAIATGITNAVIEAAISPLLMQSAKLRGEDVDFTDVARNVGFALLIGGGLGGGISGLGHLATKARAMRVNEPNSKSILETFRKNNPDFNLDERLTRALDANAISRPKIDPNEFSKIDPNSPIPQFIDTFGRITNEAPPTLHFRITRQQDGTIVVAGDIEAIAKARESIASKFDDQEIIISTRNGETAKFATAKDFNVEMNRRINQEQLVVPGNKDDFDTTALINDLNETGVEIRINPGNNTVEFTRRQRNKDGSFGPAQKMTDDEVTEFLGKLNNQTPDEIAARTRNVTKNSLADESEEIARANRSAELDATESRVKNIKNEVEQDLQTRLERLPNRLKILFIAKRGKFTEDAIDEIVYSIALSDLPQAKLSRLGFQVDANGKITKIDPAKDLTDAETLVRENLLQSEQKVRDVVNDELGKLEAVKCATKKGL